VNASTNKSITPCTIQSVQTEQGRGHSVGLVQQQQPGSDKDIHYTNYIQTCLSLNMKTQCA